ncbi:MAG: TrkH family potassium uptake protein [Desulfobacteraceae bacterium]|nr:TrkH family potassium uptake protein [Desulfobacteraceae bacterium]
MRWHYISKIIGVLLIFLSFAMVLPLVFSFHYNDGAIIAIIESIAITLIAGFCFVFLGRKSDIDFLSQREGIAIVALGWTAVGLFGAFPFFLDGTFSSFTDAFFESVSGFTTTGSSVMTDIEATSLSILMWRSFIQWLGGMGIIVLTLAILPFLGVGGMQLYKAEVPSPVPDKLTPRLADSAKILWAVYAGITALEVVFLLGGGMSFFDSLAHAFTTMPTGGFSPKNTSIAYYNSAYIDYVISFFMLLAGINFALYYQLLRGKPLAFWRDTEFRFFMILIGIFTLLISFNTYGSVYETIELSFRYAFFQVISILTTTGYGTADYEIFPGLSHIILFSCMFIGASAGSTGGGMKCSRIIVGFKYCYRELFKLIHPRSVAQIKINSNVVTDDVLRSIMGFLGLYIGLFVICSILLGAMGIDMITSFAAVASCIGNIGPGFGTVGPTENFAHLPAMAKWLLLWCMLLGRLEIYTIIILLVPEFWKK